jgi:hypothetical protein
MGGDMLDQPIFDPFVAVDSIIEAVNQLDEQLKSQHYEREKWAKEIGTRLHSIDSNSYEFGGAIREIAGELGSWDRELDKRNDELRTLLQKICDALIELPNSIGLGDVYASNELYHRHALESMDGIKQELSYGLPRIAQEVQSIQGMWIISVGAMVIGMLAILGTMRHWF